METFLPSSPWYKDTFSEANPGATKLTGLSPAGYSYTPLGEA